MTYIWIEAILGCAPYHFHQHSVQHVAKSSFTFWNFLGFIFFWIFFILSWIFRWETCGYGAPMVSLLPATQARGIPLFNYLNTSCLELIICHLGFHIFTFSSNPKPGPLSPFQLASILKTKEKQCSCLGPHSPVHSHFLIVFLCLGCSCCCDWWWSEWLSSSKEGRYWDCHGDSRFRCCQKCSWHGLAGWQLRIHSHRGGGRCVVFLQVVFLKTGVPGRRASPIRRNIFA